MKKTAIVNPYWKKSKKDLPKLFKLADSMSSNDSWQHFNSIEDLLTKINFAKSKEQIPDKIVVSYQDLIERNLNPKDVIDTINLTSRIAANRLEDQFEEIIYTGTSACGINETDYFKLSSAGFRGCALSPFIYGLDAAIETRNSYTNDNWNGIVITDAQSLKKIDNQYGKFEVDLTFRQQQIANLICRRGLSNTQIAKHLGLSDSTVKMHIGLILKKYGVQHRTQLIIAVQEKNGKVT